MEKNKAPEAPRGRRSTVGWRQNLVDRYFGYDFFISYAHDDGRRYPTELADRLEARGFHVFLDTEDYVGGDDLRALTRRRVRTSSYLVVVARPAALASPWVLREVEVAEASRCIPVVVDINRTFERASRDQAVKRRLVDRLYLTETTEALDGVPSDELVAALVRCHTRRRQDAKRARFFGYAATLLAALLVAAAVLGGLAQQRGDELAVSNSRLTDALTEVRRREQLAVAEGLAARAELAGQTQPQLGLLLAAEAFRLERKHGAPGQVVAEQVLRGALRTVRGEPVLRLPSTARLRLSAEGGRVAAQDSDGVRVWRVDAPNADPVALGGGEGLALGPEGRWLLTRERAAPKEPFRLRLWDLAASPPTAKYVPQSQGVDSALCVARDARRLAALGQDDRVRVWVRADSGDYEAPSELLGDVAGIHARLTFDAEGVQLAATDDSAEALVWGLEEPGTPTRWRGVGYDGTRRADLGARLRTAAFDPKGRWLALGGRDTDVHLRDVRASRSKGDRVLRGHTGRVTGLVFSRDGRWLASSSWDKTVILWRLGEDDPAAVLRGHDSAVVALALSPDDSTLVSLAADGSVRRWSLRPPRTRGSPVRLWDQSAGLLKAALAFSPDATQLISVLPWDLRLWTIGGADFSHRKIESVDLVGLSSHYVAASFGPAGDRVAVAVGHGAPRVHQLSPTASPLRELGEGPAQHTIAVGFAPDGTLLSADLQSITRWDQADWTPWQVPGVRGETLALRFVPRTALLARIPEDGRLELWDLSRMEPRLEAMDLDGLKSHTSALAFTGDRRMAAEADDAVLYWDLRQVPATAVPFRGLQNDVEAVALAPKLLAAGSRDGEIRLWLTEPASARANSLLLQPAQGEGAAVLALEFSPDGRFLASCDGQGSILLWHLRGDDLLAAARRVTGRSLTGAERARYSVPAADRRAPRVPDSE